MKKKLGPSLQEFAKGSVGNQRAAGRRLTTLPQNQKSNELLPKQASVDLTAEEDAREHQQLQDQDGPEYSPDKGQNIRAVSNEKKGRVIGDLGLNNSRANGPSRQSSEGRAMMAANSKQQPGTREGDMHSQERVKATKSEIQELREMQTQIQKQLQDMQNTFLDKFSQLKAKEEGPRQ